MKKEGRVEYAGNMEGSCRCGRNRIDWPGAIIGSVRACQCDYCLSKSAAYASDVKQPFTLSVSSSTAHNIVRNGTKTADFHECGECGDLLCVTWRDAGCLYGVVNARCLEGDHLLPDYEPIEFVNETVSERMERRRRSWCSSISIQMTERD